MTVRFRNLVLASLGLGAVVAATPSCADNNVSMYVDAVELLTAPACTATNSTGATALSGGTVDLAFGGSYTGDVLVASQLVAEANAAEDIAEPNVISVKGAEITLSDGSGNELTKYSVTANGIIPPATNGTATTQAIFVELVPASVAEGAGSPILAAVKANGEGTFLISFKVFGETLGNINVESAAFVFPISYCYGCSVEHSAGSADLTLTGNPYNCEVATTAGQIEALSSLSCNGAQDLRQAVDCLACQGIDACTGCTTDADCSAFAGDHCAANHFCSSL